MCCTVSNGTSNVGYLGQEKTSLYIEPSDIRVKRFEQRKSSVMIFAVDASVAVRISACQKLKAQSNYCSLTATPTEQKSP